MTEKPTLVQHDTSIHVAQFLQEGIGATRQVRIALDQLPLDDDLLARQVSAAIKLTRIPTGILATGRVEAITTLQCIRCLEDFAAAVQAEFADEYRPSVDILTGAVVAHNDDEDEEGDEYFTISGLHLLDVEDSLRQALVLGLPMAPLCREDCPGLPEVSDTGEEGDARLAVLSQLLSAEEAATNDTAATGRSARRR